MIDPITAEQVLEDAIRIQVCQKRSLEVDYFPDRVRVHLPPKRVLAESCLVTMSKMTALLSEMEQNQLIGTEPRGGMWTTPRGNRIIAGCLARKYRREATALLGPVVFHTLIQHLSK